MMEIRELYEVVQGYLYEIPFEVSKFTGMHNEMKWEWTNKALSYYLEILVYLYCLFSTFPNVIESSSSL